MSEPTQAEIDADAKEVEKLGRCVFCFAVPFALLAFAVVAALAVKLVTWMFT
jgi:hypothetical protein